MTDVNDFLANVKDAKPLYPDSKMGKPLAEPSKSSSGKSQLGGGEFGFNQTISAESNQPNVMAEPQPLSPQVEPEPIETPTISQEEIVPKPPEPQVIAPFQGLKESAESLPKKEKVGEERYPEMISNLRNEQNQLLPQYNDLEKMVTQQAAELEQNKAEVEAQLQDPNTPDELKVQLQQQYEASIGNYEQAVNQLQQLGEQVNKNQRAINVLDKGYKRKGGQYEKEMEIIFDKQPFLDKATGIYNEFSTSVYNTVVPSVVSTVGALLKSPMLNPLAGTPANILNEMAGDELLKLSDKLVVDADKLNAASGVMPTSKKAETRIYDEINPYNFARGMGNLAGSIGMTMAGGGIAGKFGGQAAAFSQIYGNSYKDGIKAGLDNNQATMYASAIAAPAAILEEFGVSKLFDLAVSKGGKKILQEAILTELKKNGGKMTAKEIFDFTTKKLTQIVSSGVVEGGVEVSQGAAEFLTKLGTEAITDADFEGNLDIDEFKKQAYENFTMGVAGGGAAAVGIQTSPKRINEVAAEALTSPEKMQDFKNNLESLRINGDITPEGFNAANTALNNAINVSKTVPATITNIDDRKTAIDLIQKRDELAAQLENTDPDLSAPIQEELKTVKAELQDLAKGIKPKVEVKEEVVTETQPTTEATQATQETKTTENAIQEPSTTQEIPRTREGGENIAESSQGVRPSEQGQETAQQGEEEVKAEIVDIETKRKETEAKIKRKDLFDGVGDFSSQLGGSDMAAVPISHKEINGIEFVEYAHPKTGSVDVIVTGKSDNDFVGFYRIYENGKPTNKWSSKFENQSRNKEDFKTMISGVQQMLPKGHEYTEKTSISTDGLRVWNQQLSRGYELQYDKNGKLITNLVAINGDAIVNELGIPVQKGEFENIRVKSEEDFEIVKKALLPYLEKLGLGENDIRWLTGTVKINLPVLKNTSQQQTTKTKTDEKTEERPMLEGLQATRDEGKGRQAGAELRTKSQAQEKEIEELAEPIVIFKGNTGKLNPDGSRRTAHPNIKGVFGSTDLKSAERYGNDISKFDIPKGTTVETVEIKNKKIPLSEARKQETELVNASDAQIVRLITYDAKGREVQYIIKDKSILQQNKPIKNAEELSKAESKIKTAQVKDIVLDEDGKPLVVYHGTGTDFDNFDSEKSTDATRFGKGVSFTTGKGIAMRYSLERQGLEDNMENDEKAIIKSANLIMKKPFDERGAVDNTTPEAIKLKEILVNKYGLNPKYVDNVLSGNTPSSKSAFQLISEAIFDPATDKKTFMFVGNTEKTRKLLEEVGYDSIIDRYEDSFEYFVFDTKNIIPITKENLTPNIPTNETKNENGKQKDGEKRNENVSENVQGNGKEGGQNVNLQNEEEVTQPRLSDFGLTYKNVNDKFNEVSKIMPYRALETALENLGVERGDLDSAKEAFLAEFISKDLPSKLPNKKDKFDKDDLPKGEVVVKPIIKKITPSNPSNTKTKIDSLKNIVGNDDLRPVMNGVFQDAENGMLAATDAFKLITVSDATITESKIVDPKTGQTIQGRFPNYLAIIPQNNPIQVDVNVQDLINQTAGISRASDFFVGKNEFAIAVRIKIGDNNFYFNPKLLNDVLTVFANYGAKDVTFKLSTPTRAMVIEYGGVTGLLMPVMGENNQGDVLPHVTVVNRELTNKEKADGIKTDLEYLAKKLEDKKKKLSDAKNNVRNASSNKDLNSANFDVKYEEKAVAEAQLEYDNKKAELDNLDNPLQEQFDLETVKTAIENGEITEQEATEFIESTIENTTEVESVIATIESKAESENEVELNEVIQNADKLISSEEGTQGGTDAFADLANQFGEAAKEAVKPETPTAQTFADISQNGKAGRDARESARKKFGKDAVAKMEEISRNFDKLIEQLESENKVRKECP